MSKSAKNAKHKSGISRRKPAHQNVAGKKSNSAKSLVVTFNYYRNSRHKIQDEFIFELLGLILA